MHKKTISKRMKIVLIAISAGIVLAGIVTALIFIISSKEEIEDTPIIENGAIGGDFVAVEIRDYVFGELTKTIQGIFKGGNAHMNVYENGVVIGYDATASLNEYRMELDIRNEKRSDSDSVDLNEYKADYPYVYNIEQSKAEQYIRSKIASGEELLREVETYNYCEAYLKNDKEITRYIITKDRLVVGTYSNELLPGMTTYFNFVASDVEN